MEFSRQFAMPNEATFEIKPISDLLDRWLKNAEVIIDPFARNSKRGTFTNDLNPRTTAQTHLPVDEFFASFQPGNAFADAALLDPPYSPRQIVECYRISKRKAGMLDTQNARLLKVVKDGLDRMLKRDGIAICCGWNSGGFGKERGYELLEILLVNHGAAHNDTIVTVERKMS